MTFIIYYLFIVKDQHESCQKFSRNTNLMEEIKIILSIITKFQMFIIQNKINPMKLNNKETRKNLQRYMFKTNQLKNQTRNSFDRVFNDNVQFDSYIKSQFEKMVQEKSQNPTLIIPKGFKQFLSTKLFKQLLKQIYEYLDLFLEFQRKYRQQTKEDINSNNMRIMRHETYQLEQKCKQISYVYVGILLGYGDNKQVFHDQYFFETMMYFLSQVLRGNFQQIQFLTIQEELNRIFRTNAFNLIKRRHDEDNLLNKQPILKQVKYQCSPKGADHLIRRLSFQKKTNYAVHLRPQKINKLRRPMDISLSTFKSVRSRSPLISSYYPSQKQKLFGFEQYVREKDTFVKSMNKRYPQLTKLSAH